jgi:hypothetical protein
VAEKWRAIQQERFPELVLDCGDDTDPGVRFCEDLRDWSDKATTPDQYRIEDYVARFDLRDRRILHIGIGNSGLAKRFHRRVGGIVGTTIDEPEVKVAATLDVPNYKAVRHNKYSGEYETIPGTYDFIIDNNPTSPCCCFRHLSQLFAFYEAKLAPGGQVVTDLQGLQWVPEDANPRWSFSLDDLAAVAELAGLSTFRINKMVCVMARSRPTPPELWYLARQRVRRLASLPRRLAGKVRYGLLRGGRSRR